MINLPRLKKLFSLYYNSAMPLLWLSGSFLLGIWLSSHGGLPSWVWGLAGLASTILVAAELKRIVNYEPYLRWRESRRIPFFALVLALSLGAFRLVSSQRAWTHSDLAYYNGSEKLLLRGEVILPPSPKDRTIQLTIKAKSISERGNEYPVKGRVLVVVRRSSDWRFGDEVTLFGRLESPPEDEEFSYKDYLARQGVYSWMVYPGILEHIPAALRRYPVRQGLYNLRLNANQFIQHALPQPESALLAGILLGYENDIPPDLMQDFRDTGISHIIAISGFNIAILAGLFTTMAGKVFRPRMAALAAITGIFSYTVLVGAQASVVRAAIMGGLGLFGHLIGRRQSGLTSLGFTAAVMAILNPLILWDASFQLSFSATLGLILFADPLQSGFIRLAEKRIPPTLAQKLAKPVGEYLLFTLAAQLTTIGIVAALFQRVSLIGLVANPLVLPLQPAVMVIGGLAVITGLVFAPLGQILTWVVWPFLAYTNRMAELLARIPGGALTVDQPGLGWMILYIAFIVLLASKPRLEVIRKCLVPGLLLVGFGLTALVWRNVQAAPDGKLHLTILTLPDGPGVLVRTPNGHQILLDSSSSGRRLSTALDRRLPPFQRTIDALVLAGTSGSALDGLPFTVERFPPRLVWFSSDIQRYKRWQDLMSKFYEQGTPVKVIEYEETIHLDDGVEIRAIAASDESAAILIAYNNFRGLIPAGNTPDALPGDNIEGMSVLLLTERDLTDTAAAGWEMASAVLILESNPKYDYAGWLPVDHYGWVEIITDGEHMWAETGN